MENMDKIVEYAPYILIVIFFLFQNKVFVRPEQLTEKQIEIIEIIDNKIDKKVNGKYVEINAYKEFQNRVYSELEKVSNGISELKDFLMKG